MCSITAIPVMCSTPAQSTLSLLKELYHQWRVQEFVGGEGRKSKRIFFFFLLFNFSREGPAQKIADKIIFPTKKVARYR